MSLRQRQPREEDPAYLAYVRTLPCLICGRHGPSDAAHIRSAAPHYGKRYTGKAEKPDDKWALPLCRRHHEEQHRTNELGWWAGKGIADPFALCVALYAGRPGADRAPRQRRRIVKTFTRKPPKEQRRKVPAGRKLESRSDWPEGRKLATRPLRKERAIQ